MSARQDIQKALVALDAGRLAAAENLLGYAIAAIRAETRQPLDDLASDLARASGTARHAGQERLARHLLMLAGKMRSSGGRYATETAYGTRTGD